MAEAYMLALDDVRAKQDTVGGKGAALARLYAAGFPVPEGFHLTTAAYRRFVTENALGAGITAALDAVDIAAPETAERASTRINELFAGAIMPQVIAEAITQAYAALPGDEPAVAVRSSATAEDLPDASFAGQQETVLNVRGDVELRDAVRRCWASLWTARAIAYRARQRIEHDAVALAVVVQRMVPADSAGVLFTANPSNGRRDEAVISAAWGLGESVVSGSVSPDAITVDKASGRVRSRQTGDKQVMTVRTAGGVEQRPVPEAQRQRSALDDRAAGELAQLGTRIEEHFGAPQDIEWAHADGQLFILQARPITALPEPRLEPPTDWAVPDRSSMYVRASIVEQLPDPLSPLFADLSADAVPRSLDTLLNELVPGIIRPGELTFPTVNGYAYYRYSARALWRITRRSLRALRPAVLRTAVPRWREVSRPRYADAVQHWAALPPETLPTSRLLAGAEELVFEGALYYTSVQTIIPLASGSEALFTAFYDRVVRRQGDPPAQTFLLGFDSVPIQADKALYDLAGWCRGHPALAKALSETPREDVLELLGTERPPAAVDERVWQEWRARFQSHLQRYGHMVYNLDFVNAVPADDPAPVFDTLKFFICGEGTDPHERQQRAAARRQAAGDTVPARLDAPRRAILRRLLGWAQSVAPLREDALADVGLGWPVMRRLLLEAGLRLVGAGAIAQPADVFWLTRAELQGAAAALDAGETRLDSVAGSIERRQMAWRGQKLATPPGLLPKRSWVGVFESVMPAAGEQTGAIIKGVAASPGQVTGVARVLAGPQDFGQMRPGEVLVAGITTPAWTSLFALASAVVTDVGGPLSHSSIVAREYEVPAVLGTGVATHRIRSGQRVRVDGDAGTVTLLDEAEGQGSPHAAGEPGQRFGGRARTIAAASVAAGAAAVLTRRRSRRRGSR